MRGAIAAIAPRFLPTAARRLGDAGVELRGCEKTRALVPNCLPATEEDWYAEYLDLILAVRVVDTMEDAILHITKYGSQHTEAIVTGTLAGHNAVRHAAGVPLLRLPTETAVGDFIAYSGEAMKTDEGKMKKYTFSGSVYFERMQTLDLYTTDIALIQQRVARAGVAGVFERPIANMARLEAQVLESV